MKTAVTVTIIAATAVLGVGGVAAASIPDSGGVIHACYKTPVPTHGTPLQVIDTGGSCPGGTAPLNWNQTGPQGPTGAQGAPGPAGPQGPAGVSGYQVETYTPSANGGNGDNPLGSTSNFNGTGASFQLYCPAGKTAISGGWSQQTAPGPQAMIAEESYPFSDAGGSGWRFTLVDYGSTTSSFAVATVYATCENTN